MKTSKKVLSLLLIAVMLVSMLCMGVSATTTYEEVSISEGEPVTISWNGTTGTVVNVDPNSSYIPKQFILWARSGFTVSVNGTNVSAWTASYGTFTDYAYTIPTDAENNTTIVAANGTTTYTITCPHYTATSSADVNPKVVNGYLPVGQFARWNSFGWGALYTDGTNIKSSSNDAKFKDGYASTGVSLGMAGGYVQFDMGDNSRIQNDPNNKYGIDFIVYGNAFVGNPEAAGVQVSNDGVNWYTLAGSRHYMDGTKWNQNISYIRIADKDTTISGKTFASAGIYTSTDFVAPATDNAADVNAAIGEATWAGVPQLTGNTYPKPYDTATPAAAAWWPEWENDSNGKAENYKNVWNIDNEVKGVSWLRSGSAEVITYKGVTIVEDDMVVLNRTLSAAPSQAQMTDVYQWGYADVRTNGSAYGTISNNPYAAAPSTQTGGDGFDLSWAVKADGTPIALSSARYVRVYSAVLFSAGVFGETSAEVCGLYVVNHEDSAVGTSNNVELWADGADEATPMTLNDKTTVAAGTYYLYSTETNVYVNGEKVTVTDTEGCAITIAAGQKVQIVAQSGNAAPFLTVLYAE